MGASMAEPEPPNSNAVMSCGRILFLARSGGNWSSIVGSWLKNRLFSAASDGEGRGRCQGLGASQNDGVGDCASLCCQHVVLLISIVLHV